MTKTEIMSVLQQMGYNAVYDNDGDIMLRYQLKEIFFIPREDEDFMEVILFNLMEIDEGEEHRHLLACNMIARKIRMAKTYVDPAKNVINASCEFFYTDIESVKKNIGKTIEILGIIRTTYCRFLRQLSD